MINSVSDNEFSEILEAVILKTKVESFRLSTDPAHPEYVPGMREAVILIYRGEKREAIHQPQAAPPPLAALGSQSEPQASVGLGSVNPQDRPSNPIRPRSYDERANQPLPTSTTAIPVADSIRLQSLVRQCEYFVKRNDLGCGCNHCKAGRGNTLDKHKVSWNFCMACINDSLPENERIEMPAI